MLLLLLLPLALLIIGRRVRCLQSALFDERLEWRVLLIASFVVELEQLESEMNCERMPLVAGAWATLFATIKWHSPFLPKTESERESRCDESFQ